MEYEMAEEGVLLDRSNNPSLDLPDQMRRSQRIVAVPLTLRMLRVPQKAVLIPEETDRA